MATVNGLTNPFYVFFVYVIGVPVGLYFLGYLNPWLWFIMIPFGVVTVFWFWFNAWYEGKYL